MDNTEMKLVPDDTHKIPTIDDMPPEILLKIIGYLSRDDLITAQRVCHYWRTTAHDISLWKDYTFVITGTPEDEKKIKVMPALRNIDGYAHNRFVNMILHHVTGLNKMNCKFKPPMSFAQVQSLVQRYPELESVTLDACVPDTLQSVEVLQTCENLKELIFHRERSYNISYYSHFQKFVSILNIFADCNNFTTLNNLVLDGLVDNDFFENQSHAEVFTRVLTNRSHQILSLRLDINSIVDEGVTNAINMCSSIQFLSLTICNNCAVGIDISRMTQLRSIILFVNINNNDFVKALHDSFSRSSWDYLTSVKFCSESDREHNGNILGALINNARQLRELHFNDTEYSIYDWQIEHIGNLSNLEELFLLSLNNISKESVIYISHCLNLKVLCLCTWSTSITDLKPSVANMICSMKQLRFLIVRVAGVAIVSLNDKEAIKMFISQYLNNE